MEKIPKSLLVLIIIAVLAILLLLLPSKKDEKKPADPDLGFNTGTIDKAETTTESQFADIDPIELPKPEDVTPVVGFIPKQADRLTDKYVLHSTEFEDNKAVYYYQQHISNAGNDLTLEVNKMTQEEYDNFLPTDKFENVLLNELTLTYTHRVHYYLKDGTQSQVIQELVEDNIAVVEYGSTMDELSRRESISWYQDGFKYEIVAFDLKLGKEGILALAESYINS